MMAIDQQHIKQEHGDTAERAHIFQVFDRRINFTLLPENVSLYSMLRGWVQDDPTRLHPSAIQYQKEPPQKALPKPAPETAMTLLQRRRTVVTPSKRKGGSSSISNTSNSSSKMPKSELNTYSNVAQGTLLDVHIGYMKQVRKGWQKTRARRYQRFKARLNELGVPACHPLEKALADDGSVMSLGTTTGGGGGGDASSLLLLDRSYASLGSLGSPRGGGGF